MIEWASPWALFLLIPVLLLPLQGWLTGKNRLAVAKLDAVSTRVTPRLLVAWMPRALQMVGLVLLVIALARPRLTLRHEVVESEGLDIVLAVDTSGSMEQNDMTLGVRNTDRLTVAKTVMARFIEGRPHDRIGVVPFGEEAFTHVPLTLDHATLLQALKNIEIGMAGAQGTAVGSAIAVSAKRLKDLEAPDRVIILLTDGRNNAGRVSPLQAAQAAAALDITVYTVGVGSTRRGIFGSLGDGLDEEGLTQIAETTGGRFFMGRTTDSLEQIYATIDELEPSPAEVRDLVRHEERFRGWLWPGLALLFSQVFLSATWLRRGP
jgi:Ca-activated chloride channel homolog